LKYPVFTGYAQAVWYFIFTGQLKMHTMKPIMLISSVLFSISAMTQNCDDASLVQKPGVWKVGLKGSEGGSAAELAAEKKIVAAIHTMIKSKYTPMGVEAIFHGAYNPLYPDMTGNSYAYSIIPLEFYCDGNKIKTVEETSTFFSITANLFSAEIYELPDNSEVASGAGYHYLSDMPVEKDGYWYFAEKDVSPGSGIKRKSSAWLITYNGKLPFSYVTKKEFLETRKIILNNAMQQSASGFKNVLKNLEIEKGYKQVEYKSDPDKLNKYMKMDYLDSKARYEKYLADNEKNYRPAFNKIEAQLKMSAAELNQPAIVKMDPADPFSYLFTEDNDPFGQVLIKPNPGYFNKKLPKSSPQFFWIYLAGKEKEAIAGKFMSDIMKAVDFTFFKNMLGK
jgi:hypothetical protein